MTYFEKELEQVPVLGENRAQIGKLQKIDSWILEDDDLLEEIARWRNVNSSFFMSRFTATLESTKHYFSEKVISSSDTVMYLIQEETGRNVGHFGYVLKSNEVELHNLVRSDFRLSTNFILFAELALVAYLREIFPAKTITLKVLSSNVLARRLHDEIGFQVSQVTPLFEQRISDDRVELSEVQDQENANVNFKLLKMTLPPNSL